MKTKLFITLFVLILTIAAPVFAEYGFEIHFEDDFVRFEFKDAHMSIGRYCENTDFEVIEIIPASENEPNYDYLDYFAYEMLILFNVEFDWILVFPNGLPSSFTPENMGQLRVWHSQAECFDFAPVYTTFLPIITN